jgi:transposase-like protein
MVNPESTSAFQMMQQFPTDDSARIFFEVKRWGSDRCCPHCGSLSTVECKNHKPMPYRCKYCRKHFSVRTGTVLAESKIGLQKWVTAIWMMTSVRKGIPSTQMARELGITQKSAWFLAQRIRETWMANKSDDDNLAGEVEVDEIDIGYKSTNHHASKNSVPDVALLASLSMQASSKETAE